jgi:EAL domain-containing protein (putative c-di-GMP-specific phosphodiesterase class I)
VETGEQLDILRGQGCQEIQGYLVSKPLPPDKVMELFDKPQLSNFAPAGLTV